MTSNKSLLLIYAHPDDETVFTGGTISKYSSSGVEVYLLCATSGEMGKTSGICNSDQLAKVREEELKNIADLLGIKEIIFLRYPDKQLDNIDSQEIIEKIAEAIIRIKPTAIITFGPDGATGHIDHKTMNKYATSAYDLACKGIPSSQSNDSFKVPNVFHVSLQHEIRDEWRIIEEAIEPNIKIDIKDYSHLKLEAIRRHRTQRDSLCKFLDVSEPTLRLFLEQETFVLSSESEDRKNISLEEIFAV